jgi:flagellum-specific peptidoglycan hydrolase FlgJ
MKDSIRGYLNLLATDDRYEDVRKAQGKGVETMFKGMSAYAQDPNYVEKLLSVYKNQIKAVLETENMLVPKVKPLDQQMNNLK